MTFIFPSRLICFWVVRLVYGRSYVRGNTSEEGFEVVWSRGNTSEGGFEVVRSQCLSHSMCNRYLIVCTRTGKNTPCDGEARALQ